MTNEPQDASPVLPPLVTTPVEPSPEPDKAPGISPTGGRAPWAPADSLAFLWQVHQYINGYIRFSDQKAGVVIVFTTGVIAAMFGRSLHMALISASPTTWLVESRVSGVAFLLLTCALVSAAWSIRPRLPDRKKRGIIFWDNILNHGDPVSYLLAVSRPDRELAEELASHVFVIAGVSQRKFFWSGLGVTLAIVGSLAGAISLVLNA